MVIKVETVNALRGLMLQVKHVQLDLGSKDSMLDALTKIPDVTHVFFCAYQPTESFAKDATVNFAMFKSLVEALEKTCKGLKHVHFISGTKWYGEIIFCDLLLNFTTQARL